MYAKVRFYDELDKLNSTDTLVFSAEDIKRFDYSTFITELKTIHKSFNYKEILENNNIEEVLRNLLNTDKRDVPHMDDYFEKLQKNTMLYLTVFFIDGLIKKKLKNFSEIESEIEDMLSGDYKFKNPKILILKIGNFRIFLLSWGFSNHLTKKFK
jgi:hypothetical protein